MITPALQRDLNRWYKLKPVEEQLRLVESKARFNVICAGRRSGKTERAKRRLIKEAMTIPGPYFIGAPTIPQARLIYWDDIKRMALGSMQKARPLEAQLVLPFDNGSTIHLLGMEHPKRFEGPLWLGGLLDEVSYFKENAWTESIAPALDTENPERPGYKAWCWLLGKPNGLNHFYRMYNYAKTANDPEWAAFHWHSSEVLSPEAIAAAMRRMSASQFRQEYEASFETSSGRICPDYNELNTTDRIIQSHEEIYYCCDFNFTPMSHAIGVRDENNIYFLDEIILTSAIAEQNALEFCDRYKNHDNKRLKLFGDASGKAGEKHGHESNYTNMERIFNDHGWNVDRCVKSANPAIRDRQNAVRAKVCNALGERSMFVNPGKAPWTHESCLTVQFKEGSAFIEDDKNKYQHVFTAIGYEIDYLFPIEDWEPNIEIWMP